EPQPDVALLRYRPDFYASAHPGPEDVLLVVEVAETSADYDRSV
ncbi:Putative restriction endonuclease, partial [Thermoflexus hugenholtzii JAD2]